ncbi:MAG TPA: hypothetical protein VE547_22695, partial [Mycobacteriales bacterium]|nr:hypothetical protein [Mycobacteriales bacterium]
MRRLAGDSAVAALLLALTLAVLASGGFGAPDPRAQALDGVGALLAAAATLPVLAWRVAPLTAYLAV